MSGLHSFEIDILNAIQTIRTDNLDDIMVTVTALGNASIFWISILLVFLTTKRYKKMGEIITLSFILNIIVVNIILKIFVGRLRPYEAVGFTDLLISHLSDNSFPSGHTSYAFSFVSVLWFLGKSKIMNWYMTILAVLIALSRLYLYVHYPSDVLAGAIIGVLLSVLAIKIYDSEFYKKIRENIIYKGKV